MYILKHNLGDLYAQKSKVAKWYGSATLKKKTQYIWSKMIGEENDMLVIYMQINKTGLNEGVLSISRDDASHDNTLCQCFFVHA